LNQAYTDKKGVNNRAFVEAIAGGPYEEIPWAIYNSVGTAYPYFTRKQKNDALSQILRILDVRNYLEVNGDRGAGHTTGIREPLLLTDICSIRPIYWPGTEEGIWLMKQFQSFSDFKEALMHPDGVFKHLGKAHVSDKKITGVNSDFVVAYALLRMDIGEWQSEFIKAANPAFLDRTIQGLVNMYFSGKSAERQAQERESFRKVFPKEIQHQIDVHVERQQWITDYCILAKLGETNGQANAIQHNLRHHQLSIRQIPGLL
jgi:hypothetical protein